MIFRFLLIVFLISSSACKKADDVQLSPLAQKGKSAYLSNCIVCHNPDPTKPGSIGPDIAFSSLELVTSRVMYAKYPPNYKPKRPTAAMPPFPMLEKDIPAIHAYLNSFKKQ